MQIYLPIAEMSVNVLLLLAIGGGVGFLSGLFGVGGGFLMTPLLIFIGVPPAVAVGHAGQPDRRHLGLRRARPLAPRQRRLQDGPGAAGRRLRSARASASRCSPCCAARPDRPRHHPRLRRCCSASIGALMLVESSRARPAPRAASRADPAQAAPAQLGARPAAQDALPQVAALHLARSCRSAIGFVVGVLSAIMGVGGGFMLVPAMIYLLGMPTSVVVGTSLFQIIFVAANVTFLQAVQNQTVDVVLALLLTDRRRHRRAVRRRGSAPSCRASSCASCWRCWCWASASGWPIDLVATPERPLHASWRTK